MPNYEIRIKCGNFLGPSQVVRTAAIIAMQTKRKEVQCTVMKQHKVSPWFLLGLIEQKSLPLAFE